MLRKALSSIYTERRKYHWQGYISVDLPNTWPAYQIYALQDPRDNLIYYSGMSANPQKRLYQHLHRYNSSQQEGNWLRELRLLDILPALLILEKVDAGLDAYYAAQVREHFWIHELVKRRQPLLNKYGVTRPYRYHKQLSRPPSTAFLSQIEHHCSECYPTMQ